MAKKDLDKHGGFLIGRDQDPFGVGGNWTLVSDTDIFVVDFPFLSLGLTGHGWKIPVAGDYGHVLVNHGLAGLDSGTGTDDSLGIENLQKR